MDNDEAIQRKKLQRKQCKDRMQISRAKRSQQKIQKERAANADAMTSKRATMSQHNTQLQRAANADAMTSKRAKMNEHGTQLQRAANADAMTSKRATMSQHENQLQRAEIYVLSTLLPVGQCRTVPIPLLYASSHYCSHGLRHCGLLDWSVPSVQTTYPLHTVLRH